MFKIVAACRSRAAFPAGGPMHVRTVLTPLSAVFLYDAWLKKYNIVPFPLFLCCLGWFGVVVGRWTCDRKVAGSTPGRRIAG